MDNCYFEQKDGLFIGSTSSPPFVALYLQKLDREYFFSNPEPPNIWLRNVDDTFVVSKQEPQIMLLQLNDILPQVNYIWTDLKQSNAVFGLFGL